MKRVHGLDTIRIIGEFFVVYFHMAMYTPHSFGVHDFGYDLISLFFLLSGCVCSLKLVDVNPTPKSYQESIEYIKKKWSFVYPLYLFICICGLVGNLYNRYFAHTFPCPWDLACYILDFLTLGPWCNCGVLNTDISSTGWYICIILSCWVIFPFIQNYLHAFWLNYTWFKIVCMHVLLVLINLFFIYIKIDSYYFLLPRMLEFIIGTALPFTQSKPMHYTCVILAIISTTSMYLSIHYNMQWQDSLCLKIIHPECTVLTPGHYESPPVLPCSTFLRRIWCKTNFTWIIIINYILSREDVLNWDFFKLLNPISLTLYLSHMRVHDFLRFLLRIIKLEGSLSDTMSVLTCYISAYYLNKAYIYIHSKCSQSLYYSSLPTV